MAMSTNRFSHRHQIGHPLATFECAMSECDLAKNHQWPQSLLGQVVRRWDTSVIDKDQPLTSIRNDSPLQGQRFPVGQVPLFQPQQLRTQPGFLCGNLIGVEETSATLAMKVATTFDENLDRFEE